MVKELEWIDMAQLAVSSRVQNDLGATAGLRYRNGRPRTSVTERVSGGGEPHPESPDSGSAVTLTRRKSHIGRDRSQAGTKGAGRSGVHSATGDDSGLDIGGSSQTNLMDRDFASEWLYAISV